MTLSKAYNKYGEQGDYRYRDIELVGYKDENGRYFSPKNMKFVYDKYENLLIKERFRKVRDIEEKNKLPKTWLNVVITRLIKDYRDNGLIEKLEKEFKDR
jgi:hypothetical protein